MTPEGFMLNQSSRVNVYRIKTITWVMSVPEEDSNTFKSKS